MCVYIYIYREIVKVAKVPDDRRAEKTLEIATTREFETWNKFLGHSGATNDVAAFEYRNGEAGTCQVRGCSEAVVAAADDQCVPFLILQSGDGAAGVAATAKVPSPHLPVSLY